MNDEGFNLVKTSIQRKNQVRSTSERAEPTQQEIDELLSERITTETELPPMQPLFRMFDVPCFYRGELVADCGKADLLFVNSNGCKSGTESTGIGEDNEHESH